MPVFPIFRGPIATFIRKYKLIRRGVLLAGAAVGVYFIGVAAGWWPNILV